MNFWKRLFKRKPKDIFPGWTHAIQEAFVCDGVQYYSFSSDFDIPCMRAMKRITFYTEMDMRVDREFLQKHVEAVNTLLTGNVVNNGTIFNIKTLNDQLRDRLNWIIDTDLVYKLASIVYFDANEDPAEYDGEYNAKKIESWKKNLKAHDFFYSAPILALIPFLKDYKINIAEYSQVTAQIKKQQLENISHS